MLSALQPSGAYAATMLGPSEEVPPRVILADGLAIEVKVGEREIILQHTTLQNMATAGRVSGTFIQELRYLGRDPMDDQVRAILPRQIAGDERSATRCSVRCSSERFLTSTKSCEPLASSRKSFNATG